MELNMYIKKTQSGNFQKHNIIEAIYLACRLHKVVSNIYAHTYIYSSIDASNKVLFYC